MLGVPRREMTFQPPAAAQVDHAPALDGADARGGGGGEYAEELVELVAVDHPRAGHQPLRISQVRGAALVHDNLRLGEHPGDVSRAARMVQVNMRHHDRGQVSRADAECGKSIADYR